VTWNYSGVAAGHAVSGLTIAVSLVVSPGLAGRIALASPELMNEVENPARLLVAIPPRGVRPLHNPGIAFAFERLQAFAFERLHEP
jgi:hypothetical protein